VTVTDAASQTATGSWQVNAPADLLLTPVPTDASCPTGADGKVLLGVVGGTPAYSYLWSNSATTQDITGLNPAEYTVTVTDNHGCVKTASAIVGQTNAICNNIFVTGTISPPVPVCYNAYQTITVAGGTSTFIVTSGGNVTFIAGKNILFEPGTKVLPGGYMIGKIYTTAYCPGGGKEPTAAVQEETNSSLSLAGFTLYPNPTNGNFTLVQKGDNIYGTVKVEVYSMSGERVLTEQMIGEKRHEFRFSEIPAGLFFVKVVADNYVETIKLIKTR
jgi:hypothetical protein